MSLTKSLDEFFYPGIRGSWDHRAFREFVLARLKPTDVMLDVGAGAGILREMNFKGLAARVSGIDMDERVLRNPYLDEGKLSRGEALPYPDGSFDVVVSCNVLEHLEQPQQVFAEVARVLRPGGRFLFKTPNRLHYVPLAASIIPYRFHYRFANLAAADAFPTKYRANTVSAVTSIGAEVGMTGGEFLLIESRPDYLRRLGAITYLGGVVYERLVNSTARLQHFRCVLIGELLRP